MRKASQGKGTGAASAQVRGGKHPLRSPNSVDTSFSSRGPLRSSVGMEPSSIQLRALVAVRLSDLTDNTTSPARQKEAGETCAASIGARVVGYATDLDVSASKKTPFERPELGAWLARPDDYDVIVFWRLDRAVRSMADMSNLAAWAREHSKRLVFAEGPGGGKLELDLTSGSIMAELIMLLLAFAAQMESQATAERVTGSRAALRTMGRWHGGQPPYGYRAAPNPDGK